MDRCPSCGSEVREDQVICVKCGVQLRALKVEREGEKEEEKNPHWYIWVIVPVVLSFIVMMLVMPLFGA